MNKINLEKNVQETEDVKFNTPDSANHTISSDSEKTDSTSEEIEAIINHWRSRQIRALIYFLTGLSIIALLITFLAPYYNYYSVQRLQPKPAINSTPLFLEAPDLQISKLLQARFPLMNHEESFFIQNLRERNPSKSILLNDKTVSFENLWQYLDALRLTKDYAHSQVALQILMDEHTNLINLEGLSNYIKTRFIDPIHFAIRTKDFIKARRLAQEGWNIFRNSNIRSENFYLNPFLGENYNKLMISRAILDEPVIYITESDRVAEALEKIIFREGLTDLVVNRILESEMKQFGHYIDGVLRLREKDFAKAKQAFELTEKFSSGIFLKDLAILGQGKAIYWNNRIASVPASKYDFENKKSINTLENLKSKI